MYNRYVPQSDGTYRRSRIPDSPPRHAAEKQKHQEAPCPPAIQDPPSPCTLPAAPARHGHIGCIQPRQRKTSPQKRDGDNSIGSFLRQLLPQNFDTGDLFVILLLLLMSGDCAEDQNTALLTLALYLFM